MWLFRSGIVVAAYIGIIVYSGIRFLGLIRYFFPSFRFFVFWPLYLLLCFSYILLFFLRVGSIGFLRDAAMLSLPWLVYFFMALFALDVLRLIFQFLHVLPSTPLFSAAGAGIALVFALLAVTYGAFNARYISTTHYDITVNKDAGNTPSLRVALVSDLHLGATVDRKWLSKIVDAVNKTKPDIICIAGDVIDSGMDIIQDLDGVTAELRRLNAPLGVYACLGNHDVDRLALRGGASTERIQEFLVKANVTLLSDEVKLVSGSFYLVGRRDARPIGLRQERKPAAELTAGLDSARPIIFLDHQPVDFSREEEAGADLIFSGHTHNGQFFPGNIATAYIYHKAGAVSYGYWRGHGTQAVVSSGAGIWGPPVRIGTKSEVAVVDIKFASQ